MKDHECFKSPNGYIEVHQASFDRGFSISAGRLILLTVPDEGQAKLMARALDAMWDAHADERENMRRFCDAVALLAGFRHLLGDLLLLEAQNEASRKMYDGLRIELDQWAHQLGYRSVL